MNILFRVFELCVVLPMFMLIEGSKAWSKYLNEDNPWEAFLWTLLVILILLFVALLIMGYR